MWNHWVAKPVVLVLTMWLDCKLNMDVVSSDLLHRDSNCFPISNVVTPCAPRLRPSCDHRKLCACWDSVIPSWDSDQTPWRHLRAWRTRREMHPQTLGDWPSLSRRQGHREFPCLEMRWRWHLLHMLQETFVVLGARVTCEPFQTLQLGDHIGSFGGKLWRSWRLTCKRPLSRNMLEIGRLYWECRHSSLAG